ncbi:MAG: hypothetical protein ACRCW0_09075 [Clostridium sp.]
MIGALLGGLGALAASAISTIGTAISTVGAAVVTGAKALIPELKTAMVVIDVVCKVCSIVSEIAHKLGLVEQDEKIEEIGAKTLQEDTRGRLDGESASEYMEYLRNEVELDREKFEKMKDEDKIACSTLGTRLVADSIEEKLSFELPSKALLAAGFANTDSQELKSIIDNFKKNNINSLDKFDKYLSNDLNLSENIKINKIIVDSIKESNERLSNEDSVQKVLDMKKGYQSQN